MRAASVALTLFLAAVTSDAQLLEEAHNHDAGALQHLTVVAGRETTFTQEWTVPFGAHQFSSTIPVVDDAGTTRLDNILLNYRYQFARGSRRWSVATRFSLSLPTGAEPAGVQFNIPFSVTLTPRLSANTNLGASLGSDGSHEVFLGQNLIFAATPSLELVAEAIWTRERPVVASGFQWHVDAGGVEVIPGVSLQMTAGGARSLVVYISVEHQLKPGT